MTADDRPRLRLDYETFSTVDLRNTNAYRYVDDPRFMPLMVAWGYEKGDIRVAYSVEEILEIPGLLDPDVLKVAHNANFERIVTSAVAGLPVGEYLAPEEYHDTMAVAAELGYPLGLDDLAVALGAERKDSAGTALINWFCKPDRKGERRMPEDHPEKWEAFVNYCVQDVRTLFDVDETLESLGGFPTDRERAVWYADQRINDRGVVVDVELAEAAVEAAEDNRMAQEVEVMRLTGVANPGSVEQLLEWLRSSGLDMKDVTKDSVTAALEGDVDDTQRRVLELRRELALVASKKFTAALEGVNSDGRLRGQFRFFGAHTGRWSGKGVQLHNLPRAGFKTEAEAEARILDLKMGAGASAGDLKNLVRPLLLGPFTVADYSAIEARVLAWLAGEEWVLEAFRAGRDLYVEQAGKMEEVTARAYDRSEGKIAVLACGYNGGVNSLRNFGAEGTDAELQLVVDAYRKSNSKIVDFWRFLGRAFWKGGPVGEHIVVEADGDTRRILLPSGRWIAYHGCEFKWVEGKYGKRLDMIFRDPRKGGARNRTYGGKLTENVTQAVARDLLADYLVEADRLGQKVVGHVHDEALMEFVSTGPHEGHSVRAMANLMSNSSPWARGLPVTAEGYTCQRYRKG